MDILTPQRVDAVYTDCLFKDGEDTTGRIVSEGIDCTVGFHPGRIEEHRQEIRDMLAELPDKFKTGGGHFFETDVDRHGHQWTFVGWPQEQLVLLGFAIGQVEYCLPRYMWSDLPFGVPFLIGQ